MYPVAIVTGAGSRLGRQIALALCEAGFNIVVHYKTSEIGAQNLVRSLRKSGKRALAIKADLAKVKEIKLLVDKTISTFGKVDLLINNAAIFSTIPLNSINERVWNKVLDVNLKGIFFCSQAVAEYMLEQKSGKIINIASLGGLQAWANHIPYSVSKAGVIMLTKCLAKALAPYILVNAIAPGIIIFKGEEPKATQQIPIKRILLRRYGTPKDITELVVFLATSGDYITGQIFSVDGGLSVQ